jgi:hypothetical protein
MSPAFMSGDAEIKRPAASGQYIPPEKEIGEI